ncbi:MAG: hypothetical protein WCQ16_02775 [Verrucomicrobiae bacterium]
MPDEIDRISKLVHEAVESAINKKIVSALFWIIGVGLLNFGAITTGVVMFWQAQATMSIVGGDRWTGTMAQVAEYERDNKNPDYKTVDIRQIQSQHYPK